MEDRSPSRRVGDLEVAQRRVRARVEPRTWEAFRLLAVELLPGREVAQRLGMSVTGVFMAKRNVKQMIQEELKILSSRPGRH